VLTGCFCLAASMPFKGQVKGYFVLPKGSPSRAGSRPGPAPALSGKHNRPLRGCPQQKRFPDGPGAIRSRLSAPSRRIPAARPGKHFSLGGGDASKRQNPGQNRKDKTQHPTSNTQHPTPKDQTQKLKTDI